MATPAAILSILVKTQGVQAATAQLGGLDSSVRKAGSNITKMGDSSERVHVRVRKSFAGMTASAAKMGAGIAAAYLSIEGAKKAIDTTDELAHATLGLHKNLGLSVKQASEWAAVARSRNVDTKALNMSFGTLSKNVEAATAGGKKQTAAFKALGVSQAALKSGNFNEILGQTADGMSHLEGGTQKTAIAMTLFGRGWQTVVPVLRNGSQAMNEQLALADKYGVTFQGKTVKSLEQFIAAQRESKFATMGLQVAVGTLLAPALTKAIGFVDQLVLRLRGGKASSAQFSAGVNQVAGTLRTLGGVLQFVIGNFRTFITNVRKDTDMMLGWFTAVLDGMHAIAELGSHLPGVGGKFQSLADRIDRSRDRINALRAEIRPTGHQFDALQSAADSLGSSLASNMNKGAHGASVLGGAVTKVSQKFAGLQQAADSALSTISGNIGKAPKTGKIHLPKGNAAGAYVNAPPSRGDSVLALLKGGEVVLNERQQSMVGMGNVFGALRATGANVIGPGGGPARMAGGGVIGPAAVSRMQAFGNSMASRGLPYTYGGGHGSFSPSPGYDCSGFVSAILHAGGALSTPMAVRQPLQGQLVAGPGKYVTVGIRGSSGKSAHTMIKVGNAYYESGGGGNGAHRRSGWNGAFDMFHLANEARSASSKTGNGQLPGAGSGGSRTSKGVGISSNSTGGGSSSGVSYGGGVAHNPAGVPEGAVAVSLGGGKFSWVQSSEVDAAAAQHNAQVQAAADEQAARDAAATQAMADLTATLQAQNELLTQQRDDTRRALNTSQSQYGVLAKAIADVASGQIGGKAGLGFMTPSFAGGMSRY